MGIQITLQSMAAHAQIVQEVEFVEPQPRQQFLPPSAVRIRPSFLATEKNSDASVWLMEGDSQNLMVGDQVLNIYFGRDNVQLPFEVELVKFHKKDYPGTETPMSFESQVKVPGLGEEITISMNEPLKHEGFTLYQASYEMNPGSAPASIFSVNQDPGRPVKYAGSLILVVGIAVFVLMRSRLYQKSRFAK
jgi:cytochrome c biogenesis protein ResB